jgi:hypothetical protein
MQSTTHEAEASTQLMTCEAEKKGFIVSENKDLYI